MVHESEGAERTKAQIGRANQSAGRRYELRVLNKLRRLGFVAVRHPELSGRGTGLDLSIGLRVEGSIRWLPASTQVKATQTKSSWIKGLKAAYDAHPTAKAFYCIHRYRKPGTHIYDETIYKLDLQPRTSSSSPIAKGWSELSWEELAADLRDLLPHARPA